jgi:hypothetical protein
MLYHIIDPIAFTLVGYIAGTVRAKVRMVRAMHRATRATMPKSTPNHTDYKVINDEN